MSDESTPATDGVRWAYATFGGMLREGGPERTFDTATGEFDRWLAEHDRQVKVEELREAANGAEKAARGWRTSAADPMNPSGSAEWDRRNAEARESAARWLRARATAIGANS